MVDDPVDAAVATGAERGDREVLGEGPPGARREVVQPGAGRVGGAGGDDLARVPVVADLVVVPLDDVRHLRVEPAQCLVEQVVAEVAAVVVQRHGDMGLLLGRHVPVRRAVRERGGGRDGAVGVDVVATAQEEVGVQLRHGVEDAVTADGLVDAPALAGQVTGPHEPHTLPSPRRRRAEGSGHRLARTARVVGVGEPHPVVDLLAGRQPVQPGGAGEVGVRAEQRALQAAGVAERLGRRGLDDHPGRTVRTHPDQTGVGGHVPRLHAPGRLGTPGQRERRRRAEAGGQGQGRRRGQRAAQHTAAAGMRTVRHGRASRGGIQPMCTTHLLVRVGAHANRK